MKVINTAKYNFGNILALTGLVMSNVAATGMVLSYGLLSFGIIVASAGVIIQVDRYTR